MSKIKIEDLPSLEDLDPEDQRLIRGGKASPKERKRPRSSVRTRSSYEPDEDIIISRIPSES